METNSIKKLNSEWLGGRGTDPAAPAVLIADDSEADVFFLLRAFANSGLKNPVHVVRSGAEAIDYIAGIGKFADRTRFPAPKIVFLDLQMPYPDGFEVLRWKEQRRLDSTLWVATSNFDGVRTINAAYAAGATTFLTKPLDSADVRNLLDAFDQFWIATGGAEASAKSEDALN